MQVTKFIKHIGWNFSQGERSNSTLEEGRATVCDSISQQAGMWYLRLQNPCSYIYNTDSQYIEDAFTELKTSLTGATWRSMANCIGKCSLPELWTGLRIFRLRKSMKIICLLYSTVNDSVTKMFQVIHKKPQGCGFDFP